MASGLVERVVVNDETTDFAILSVGSDERPDCATLATSIGPSIGLTCGSRYAELETVEVERWASEPPDDTDQWEEWDEIPVDFTGNDAPVLIAGFEEFGDSSLDVAGMDRGRARVCVRGRGAVPGGDMRTSVEHWRVRLWPDGENLDAMSGGPRVLIREFSDLQPVLDDVRAGVIDKWMHRFHEGMWDLAHLVRWAPELSLIHI